jgi:hypothetical protein
MLKTVYDECTLSKSNVFKWHKRFREGREDVNDDEMKRKEENVAKAKELVRYYGRLTCRMIVGEPDMSRDC